MTEADTSPGLIDDVADWLMSQALQDAPFDALFEGCCRRLHAAGVPLWRGHIAFTILHPLHGSTALTWVRHEGLTTESHPRLGEGESYPETFTLSPPFFLIENKLPFLRRHLVGEQAMLDFPMLTDLRDKGATDYLTYMIGFSPEPMDGMIGSWTTDRDSGFSDRDINALQRVQQRLGVACKMRVRDQIARNVVSTYLGADAGLRVLNGQIRRGDVEAIRAVIWYSDLRGSTEMAERLSPRDYISLLNEYFEATAGAVLAHGGDVLSFIGDAVLAIFPITEVDGAERAACERALAASATAKDRLAAVNATRIAAGDHELRFGLGLHVGDVLFGNIGVAERVSFSVIGPTVNEVARLESLTKELDRPVVVSETFARALPVAWTELGSHHLRGVDDPIALFAPP